MKPYGPSTVRIERLISQATQLTLDQTRAMRNATWHTWVPDSSWFTDAGLYPTGWEEARRALQDVVTEVV